MNVCSLTKNFNDFNIPLIDLIVNFDILAITESWIRKDSSRPVNLHLDNHNFFLFFVFNQDLLHARLNSHYKTRKRKKKKKHEKIKAYKKSLYKELAVNRCLLILDLKPFRS